MLLFCGYLVVQYKVGPCELCSITVVKIWQCLPSLRISSGKIYRCLQVIRDFEGFDNYG